MPNITDFPPEFLGLYLTARNDAIQDVCRELIEAAGRADGAVKDPAAPEVAKILRAMAYKFDRLMVTRDDNLDRDPSLNEKSRAKVREVLDKVNEGRERIVPILKWKKVLGFSQDEFPTPKQVRDRYRDLARKHHPDRGGDKDKFVKIGSAKDEALEYLGDKEPTKPPDPCEPCSGRGWTKTKCEACNSTGVAPIT